jgi:predicted membrane channel-forming protein YqfA (hemolysin III family)
MRGAGGTEGGIGLFLIGFCCAVAGGWLLMNQVTVSGGAWTLWGYNSFGLSLVPFILGVGLLFFDGRSVIGWLLLIAGLAIVLAGVLMNLRIYFQPTSLFNTLMMLALLAGGIGMIARSLRSAEKAVEARKP